MRKIIVALDGIHDGKAWEEACVLAAKLKDKVWGFKVNDAFYNGHYWSARLLPHGNLMIDLKLYDIPNTMRNTVKHLLSYGPTFLTVHASAGVNGMKAAVEAAGKDCKIIAVTALTSFTEEEAYYTFGTSRAGAVGRLAEAVKRAGAYGTVCSVSDLPLLANSNLVTICPGIRPDGLLANDDQANIGLGEEADYVVVGRPITESEDPVAVVDRLNEVYGKKEQIQQPPAPPEPQGGRMLLPGAM